MTSKGHPKLDEGGARQKGSSGIDGKDDDPALRKENRQGVKNQSQVKPEDYPDRDQTPV